MDGMNRLSLFSGERSIEALRSTGYKSTAHALGELVDNSIQANADMIKIIVEVQKKKVIERTTENIVKIAVIDNGTGMNSEELVNALLFGQGSHFEEKGGLGKFGVGLPQASLSQGTKLDVWTWQNGLDSSIKSGFDLNDKEWRSKGCIIPTPVASKIPEPWIRYADIYSKTGTLVVWSALDKISCSRASTLFDNSEHTIGRMYRNWINDGFVNIEYVIVNIEDENEIDHKQFRAVDPLYLMENTSVVDKNPPVNPMFEAMQPVEVNVHIGNINSTVTIKSSIAKPEVLKLVNNRDRAGNQPYGKDALKNIGLSIVREGRELQLDPNWTMAAKNSKDPRHRWWGIEVDFNRELDDVFGVANDKQSATKLNDVCAKGFEDFAIEEDGKEKEDKQATKDRLREENPYLYAILMVSDKICEIIEEISNKIPEEKRKGGGSEHPKPGAGINGPLEKSTDAVNEQKRKGVFGNSDKTDELPTEVAKNKLVETLENIGATKLQIEDAVNSYVTYGYKFHFLKQNMPGNDAFFDVRTEAGLVIISLNSAHPLYDQLFSSFDYVESDQDYSKTELELMLTQTSDAIKFLLTSYARMEDIAINNNKRGASSNRVEWGKQARQMKGIFDEDD